MIGHLKSDVEAAAEAPEPERPDLREEVESRSDVSATVLGDDEEEKRVLVKLEGSEHPWNWSKRKRSWLTA